MVESVKHTSARKAGETVQAERQRYLALRQGDPQATGPA